VTGIRKKNCGFNFRMSECGFRNVSSVSNYRPKGAAIALQVPLWFSLRFVLMRREADFSEQSIGFQMNNVVPFPRFTLEPHEAALASANTIAATIHTIATAHVDYTKKAIQDGTDFLTRLTSLQSPEQAMGLQSEFAQSSYQAFIIEMKRISELYVDLLEHTFEPFETMAHGSKF
jgi:Phasin protein